MREKKKNIYQYKISTMHFPTALQEPQRLNKDYPQSHTPNMSYPPSAQSPHQQSYSSGYGAFGAPTHFNNSTYAVHPQHYSPEQLQQHQQQQQQQQRHQHYDNIYNGRLIDASIPSSPSSGSSHMTSGPVSSFYSNRARYLPYQQTLPPHAMRGMYTPGGQQLVPSSVLHYPPRGAPYQQNALALQQQRSITHTQYTLPQHTQPQSQPQLRQQQQPQSHSHLQPHPTTPFGGNEPQIRHYADTPNKPPVQLPACDQATRPTPHTPHLIMHLNGGSPPATAATTTTPPPAPTLTPQSVARPPSVDCSAYLQLQRQQHMQLQQQYRQQEHISALALQTISNDALSSSHSQNSKECAPPPERSPMAKLLPASNISSELPKISEIAQVSTRECREEELQSSNSGPSSVPSAACTSTVSSPRLTASNSECLTTSPPLISATGTDSGISVSSYSTRARSDSTQSTPVYNGEYPMSVGSSSGVSYHCADIKDFEDFGREKEEQSTCTVISYNENLKLKQEIIEDEINEGQLKESAVDGENTSTSKMKEQPEVKEYLTIESAMETTKPTGDIRDRDNTENAVPATHLQVRPAPLSTPLGSTKYFPVDSAAAESTRTQLPEENSTKITVKSMGLDEHMNASTNPNCTNESKESTEQPLQQQQKQMEPEEIISHTVHMRTNFGSSDKVSSSSASTSPNHSLHFEHTQLHHPELPSPPVPPAPPQNSPVDYYAANDITAMGAFAYTALPSTKLKPPTGAAAAAAAAVAAAAAAAAATIRTNKSRIMESDLIQSRKIKRKTHLPGKRQKDIEGGEVGESSKDNRDMTPLPGFQQAFGSTEIGRFFETFLFSPPDCHSFNDSYESFDVEDCEQLQQIHQQQQQQQQQQQLQMQQEQQHLQHNQIRQQQQQSQQQPYATHDYFNRRYSDNSSYHTQRFHPHYPHSYPHLHPTHPYYRGQVHPYSINSSNNFRDMWLYGRGAPSPYDMPFEYGGARSSSGSPALSYEMSLNARSPYGSAYDRMGHTYGRLNGGFGGIRCNGY
ncbi:histone-lysine N-methyltransferase 2D [Anastrepha obliqua]|uniref:histone-lysine N-methyltransferase 2D n=1 Tax=Anastrepha obliqua TaxID=95512 RepID=UPI002408FD7C|nr:histone-lysine N-methyltransferase 2D [Anastrepha obliqua]